MYNLSGQQRIVNYQKLVNHFSLLADTSKSIGGEGERGGVQASITLPIVATCEPLSMQLCRNFSSLGYWEVSTPLNSNCT